MKKPRAVWITLHKGDIDRYVSFEILWQVELNALHLLLFRISRGAGREQMTTEETGPYRGLVELRDHIGALFGEISARRICHNPSAWLPPQQIELLTAGPRSGPKTVPTSTREETTDPIRLPHLRL